MSEMRARPCRPASAGDPGPEVKDLSVIVVNWNGAALTAACLDALQRAAAAHLSLEVIVIDNGSDPKDAAAVGQLAAARGIALIRNESNLGFARANNQGLRVASGRYLLLLNNDTQVASDALTALIQYMEAHPEVGIAGARLIAPDGHPQPSHDLGPLPPWRLAWERALDRLWPSNLYTRRGHLQRWGDDPQSPIEVDWVLGAAMIVRRRALEEVGPLDEGYYMYAEDIDWCHRMRKAGWRVAYVPQATVVHIGGASSAGYPGLEAELALCRDRSLLRYYRRHYGLLAEALMRPVLARDSARRSAKAQPDTGSHREPRPTLAMVSTDIRRDLVAPLRRMRLLRLVHYYRQAPYGDLAPGDLDNSLVAYRGPLGLFLQLRRLHPDIIQAVEPFSLRLLPHLYACLAGAWLGHSRLVVVTLENRPLAEKHGPLFSRLLRAMLRPVFCQARLIITLNAGARRNVLSVGRYERKVERLMYGTWGVELDEFSPRRDGSEPDLGRGPVLLFVGRLHEEKGVFDLLDAYALVRARVPGTRLVLIGDGPARAEVKHLVADRGWEAEVRLMGTLKNRDLPPYLRAATVFVAPSRTTRKWEEQVGMANIQAMACGVPVVSTRSGAIPEYVPESAALLVPERNPDALAQALRHLLESSDLRSQLGQAGRDYAVAHYDARTNVERAEARLLALLGPMPDASTPGWPNGET